MALGDCGTVSGSKDLNLRANSFLPLTYVVSLGKSVSYLTGFQFSYLSNGS